MSDFKLNNNLKRLIVALTVFCSSLATEVMAQGTGATAAQADLFNQSVQLAGQASAVPQIVAIGMYVVGAFFVGRSLFALKGFVSNPDDNPITGFLAFGVIGSLMIFMPYMITLFRNTILGQAQLEEQKASAEFFASKGDIQQQMTQ